MPVLTRDEEDDRKLLALVRELKDVRWNECAEKIGVPEARTFRAGTRLKKAGKVVIVDPSGKGEFRLRPVMA